MFCRSSPVYIWLADRLKPDVRYQRHRALLSNPPSSSSYSPVSPLSLLLSPIAPSCFSSLAPHTPSSSRRCLGPFMKAALIWGNQYLLNVEGQGRRSVVVTRSGLRRGACVVGAGAGVWEEESGGGVCCSISASPLIFFLHVCVWALVHWDSSGPDWQAARWYRPSDVGLVCVSICVCVRVTGVTWLSYTNSTWEACYITRKAERFSDLFQYL